MRYLSLFTLMVKNCLIREMQFRANFLIRAFTEVLWLGMLLIYFDAIYANADDLGGWSHDHMLVLLGTTYIVNQLFEAFLFDNCVRLSDQVRLGDLDFVLVKPVNPRFLASLRYTDFASLSQALVGVLLVLYALKRMAHAPSLSEIVGYVLFLGNGLLILYSLLFTLATLAFWLGKSSDFFDLYYQLTHFGRYPAEIYRGVLRVVLTYILPMLVVTNFPAKMILEMYQDSWPWYGMGLGLLFYGISTLCWRKALRVYRSASS